MTFAALLEKVYVAAFLPCWIPADISRCLCNQISQFNLSNIRRNSDCEPAVCWLMHETLANVTVMLKNKMSFILFMIACLFPYSKFTLAPQTNNKLISMWNNKLQIHKSSFWLKIHLACFIYNLTAARKPSHTINCATRYIVFLRSRIKCLIQN